MGELYYHMADIYSGIGGTNAQTVPEAKDQTAIVDDQQVAEKVSEPGKKKFPLGLAVLLILVIAVVSGVVK